MKELFKRTTNSIIISSILACVVGFILIINPTMSIKTMGIIAAIYIILHGLTLIIIDIKATKYYIPFDGILPGILSIIIGVILILKPNILSILFVVSVGIWIALSSINSIKMSLVLKNEDAPWLLLLLLGIIDLILGIIVVFNPFEASISIAVFIGIMLIIHSIVDIIDMIVIKRDVKKISSIFERKLK